jgi:hypothetical protein
VRVSDCAILRVLVDDEPKIDFPFSALPTAATTQGDVKETEPKHFVREVNHDCELDLPAGKHTIELKNLGGDWVSLASARLVGAKSSRYADLFVYALSDAAAGETIGWIHDPESNWSNDAKRVPPRTIAGATMTLPVKGGGRFRIEWWDTRAGRVFSRDQADASDHMLDDRLLGQPATRRRNLHRHPPLRAEASRNTRWS